MNTTTNTRSGEKGFTLVELAIVMIIIGLLIGGILKGQELIANAKIASAVSKFKAVDAAINTFRDSYAGMPGDILAPASRITSCANRCNTAGNGNGQIGGNPDAANGAGSENLVAFAQLAAADLVGGIQDTATTVVVAGGTTNPQAEIPGQIFVGYAAGLAGLNLETTVDTSTRTGHYLAVYNGSGGVAQALAVAALTTLTPNQAFRVDTKMDDGAPNTGSVLAMGTAGATACASTTANTGVYNAAQGGAICGLYIRIQQ